MSLLHRDPRASMLWTDVTVCTVVVDEMRLRAYSLTVPASVSHDMLLHVPVRLRIFLRLWVWRAENALLSRFLLSWCSLCCWFLATPRPPKCLSARNALFVAAQVIAGACSCHHRSQHRQPLLQSLRRVSPPSQFTVCLVRLLQSLCLVSSPTTLDRT